VHSWLPVYLLDSVYLEILAEGVVLRDILRISRQNDVSELNAVIREAVDKVEVKIAKELRVVMTNNQNYSQGRLVVLS
jgi:predicted RNA-binding protein